MVEQNNNQLQIPLAKGKSNIKRALTFEELRNMGIPFKSLKAHYEIGKKIGKGGFGKVYEAVCLEKKIILAAK